MDEQRKSKAAKTDPLAPPPSPEQERVLSVGHKLFIFLDICIGISFLCVIAGCAAVVCQIAAQSGATLAPMLQTAVNGYFQTIGLNLTHITSISFLILITIIALVYAGIVIVILCSARRILKQTLGALTPFEAGQARRLRRLGWMSVIMAVAVALWIVVSVGVGFSRSILWSLMIGPAEILVIALLFFFLAYVFDYDALLQQQADETF